MEHFSKKTSKNKTHLHTNSLVEEATQNKAIQLQDNRPASILQQKANNTGLPNQLKSGIENLSGHSMDDVKVHYNSNKPAQLNAHAYAQGTDIHLATGQEKHLPHEAWHVVQQKQGRVKPTTQLKGKVNVNDDKGLEKEADVMGNKALQTVTQLFAKNKVINNKSIQPSENNPFQLVSVKSLYKISSNANYRTKKQDSNYLGAKLEATKPVPQSLIKPSGKKTNEYYEFKFDGEDFKNDCLNFAQKLGLTIANRSLHEILRVKLGDMETNVGFAINKLPVEPNFIGNPNSTDIADKDGFDQGNRANPSIGQTYAIVPKTGAIVDGCVFHISTVVAKDGTDTITCEADAGNKGATAPIFDMYETDPLSKLTFTARYKDKYGGDYAATGILVPPTGAVKLADATF